MDINRLKERFPAFKAVYELAQSDRGHGLQKRNDGKTPYMGHIDAVIINGWEILSPTFEIEDWMEGYFIVFAAHDLIEDCKGRPGLEDITLKDIDGLIENKLVHASVLTVLDGISRITKKEKGQEEYIDYLFRVAGNPYSRVAKKADLKHNISDLRPGNMRDKYSLSIGFLNWFLNNYVPQ